MGGLFLALVMVVLFTDRPTRIERLRLEAFPRDRWTVHESYDVPGKWAMFRGGHEYKQYDTRELAEAHKRELDGLD